MMPSDLESCRSARLLIDRHGAEAPIGAAMKADALPDKGDLEGSAVWRRIIQAIEELLRQEPGEGEGSIELGPGLTCGFSLGD